MLQSTIEQTRTNLRANTGRLARAYGDDRPPAHTLTFFKTQFDISTITRLTQPVLIGFIHSFFLQRLTRRTAPAVRRNVPGTRRSITWIK